jgi:hypothetical protein
MPQTDWLLRSVISTRVKIQPEIKHLTAGKILLTKTREESNNH